MAEHERFSKRFGQTSANAPITVREDAPDDFRYVLLEIAQGECDLAPSTLRDIVCGVLRKRPDPGNWSEFPNVWGEVNGLVASCEWYRVYDIVEAIYDCLRRSRPDKARLFERGINECLCEMGIGWKLEDGLIQMRGEEAFEKIVSAGVDALKTAALPVASGHLHDALHDLSRRPKPDLSGAVYHAFGALECVAREVTGDLKSTLGEVIKRHQTLLPNPLGEVVSKTWGYASEIVRHVREGRELGHEEAQLMVGLAATVATYLTQKTRETA